MAKSRSRKLREKEIKLKGFDFNNAMRGSLIPPNKATKTKKETLKNLTGKHKKRSDYLTDGGAAF